MVLLDIGMVCIALRRWSDAIGPLDRSRLMQQNVEPTVQLYLTTHALGLAYLELSWRARAAEMLRMTIRLPQQLGLRSGRGACERLLAPLIAA